MLLISLNFLEKFSKKFKEKKIDIFKRLLYNEDAYVMMSEPIAYKKLIDKDIVLLQKTDNTSKINFLYNNTTTYPANFLARLAQELKNAISN